VVLWPRCAFSANDAAKVSGDPQHWGLRCSLFLHLGDEGFGGFEVARAICPRIRLTSGKSFSDFSSAGQTVGPFRPRCSKRLPSASPNARPRRRT